MNLDEQTGKKIQELQILEQNIQNILMQKQTFQIEINEFTNALSDLKKSDEEVYKIVGGLMIHSNKASLVADLEEKKKLLDLRISSLEKQERILDERAENFKKELSEIVSKMKKQE